MSRLSFYKVVDIYGLGITLWALKSFEKLVLMDRSTQEHLG